MNQSRYSQMTYLGRHVLHLFPGFSYEHLHDGNRDLFRVFQRRMVTSYSEIVEFVRLYLQR